jgi:ferric-dicitrate binding protein FerR (iron transport regulator)
MVPKDPAARKRWLAESRAGEITPAVRRALEKWYGPERAAKIAHAEAFEVCEYGRQPSDEDLRRLFPMLGH